MQRTDQARVIGLVADRQHVDLEVLVLKIISVRAMANSPSRLSRKPPPTTMRSVFSHALVLRKRRVT
jgi:hypothetical protein